jgi:maltose-binding protein MalE
MENTRQTTQNLRGFSITFLSPTNSRGARVKIEDLRHNKKVIISYDYEFNNIKDIALKFLEEKGIKINFSLETKKSYILLTDDFKTQIKQGKSEK